MMRLWHKKRESDLLRLLMDLLFNQRKILVDIVQLVS